MRETPFTTTCTPDLHLKTHGPVVESIAGASESIKSFEPVHLPNPPVASTSSTAVERTIKYKPGSLRKRGIDACILKLVTTDLQPLTIVENKGFRKLLTEIDPRYEMVSRKRLTQQLLPEKYNAEKANLMQEMDGVEYIAVTTDCWTSQQTEGYMTVTAHL